MIKFILTLFLFVLVTLGVISSSIQFGVINTFLTPYLNNVFVKYVPELKIDSISYSLFDSSSIVVNGVQYHRKNLKLEADAVEIDVRSISTLIDSLQLDSDQIYKNLFLDLNLSFKDFKFNHLDIGNISFDLDKKRDEKLLFSHFIFEKMEHALDLNFYIDTRMERLLLNSNKADLTSILKLIDESYSISALVDVVVDLRWEKDFIGEVRLYSDDFYLRGIQVDKIIDTFSRPAKTEFIDVATIVALGPIGLLTTSATKMGGDLMLYSGGETYFSELLFSLKIKDNFISFKDIAFSTKKNRAALVGKINLDNLSLQNTTFYILDTNNCALISQQVKGTLTSPKIQPTKALINSLISPLVSFAKKASPYSCKKVYSGAVEAPKVESRRNLFFLRTK